MKIGVLLAASFAVIAVPAIAGDYPVRMITRDQMAAACSYQGIDTSGWTSCVNLSTKTIFVDENAGPETAAWVIGEESKAIDKGIHGYSGDPETCDCDLPVAVGVEVMNRINLRAMLSHPELGPSGGIERGQFGGR